MALEPRVLSIQSHVVSGYVGNRSAVFPLQLLGFEVDFINSVQFSNHTWYKVFKGQVLNADDLDTLYSGLKENGLDNYTHVLTGYIGDVSFLNKVCEIVTELKQKNPDLIYVCDPVMGDDGVWYVPKDLLPVYQEKVLSLADVIVPNQWEAEQLLGINISTQDDAINAMTLLHAKGPKTVALSSTSLANSETELVGYASTVSADSGSKQCVKTKVSKIPAMFIGTGDLFAALFLAWSHKHPNDIKKVLCKVQSTLCSVLETTLKLAQEQAGAGNKPSWRDLELKLVQTKAVIEQGPETVVVEDLNC